MIKKRRGSGYASSRLSSWSSVSLFRSIPRLRRGQWDDNLSESRLCAPRGAHSRRTEREDSIVPVCTVGIHCGLREGGEDSWVATHLSYTARPRAAEYTCCCCCRWSRALLSLPQLIPYTLRSPVTRTIPGDKANGLLGHGTGVSFHYRLTLSPHPYIYL